jgi:hypothetical protein
MNVLVLVAVEFLPKAGTDCGVEFGRGRDHGVVVLLDDQPHKFVGDGDFGNEAGHDAGEGDEELLEAVGLEDALEGSQGLEGEDLAAFEVLLEEGEVEGDGVAADGPDKAEDHEGGLDAGEGLSLSDEEGVDDLTDVQPTIHQPGQSAEHQQASF